MRFLKNYLDKPINIGYFDINGRLIIVIFMKSTKLGGDNKYK